MSNKTHYVSSKGYIASYPHVHKPTSSFEGGKEKFSISILIPKDDPEVETIRACEQAAIEQGISSKFGGKAPNKNTIKYALKDGDEKEDPIYHGHFYLSASSQSAPEVVGADLQPLPEGTEVIGGDFVRISVNFAPYNVGGNKGVAAYLGNVQLVKKGTPLGGKQSASADFKPVSDEFI